MRLGAVAVAASPVKVDVARTAGAAGVETVGWEGTGRDEKASKSERWFAKVFWD